MPTKYTAIKVFRHDRCVAEITCRYYEPSSDAICKHSGKNCKDPKSLRFLGEIDELRCSAKELKFLYTSEHECLRCGKKAVVINSISDPSGWLLRYDGVKLCDVCRDKQDDTVEFFKEIEEARLALESAIEVLNNSNILTGRRRAIRGQLQVLASKLKQMIEECRERKPTEEELKAEIEIQGCCCGA